MYHQGLWLKIMDNVMSNNMSKYSTTIKLINEFDHTDTISVRDTFIEIKVIDLDKYGHDNDICPMP